MLSKILSAFKVCILLLIVTTAIPLVSAAQKKSVPTKPKLENLIASSAIINGHPLLKGHPYLLAGSIYLKVLQNVDNGLLIDINVPTFTQLPDGFFLETSKRLADDSFLPVPTCALYDGLVQYKSVSGASRTVHGFKEVPCSNYSFEQSKNNQKVVTQPKEQETDSAFKNQPFNVWLKDESDSTSYMKVSLENAPVDLNRWTLLPLKNLESPQNQTMKLYFDKTTVEKTVADTRDRNGKINVRYTFWVKPVSKTDTAYIILQPTQKVVDCAYKALDGQEVTPESNAEAVYKYFCMSPDAIKSSSALTQQELQNSQTKTMIYKAQKANELMIFGQNLINSFWH